ncbi:MAG: hypothetical protein AAGJ28_14875 [Pseudomonadota bacterium]
MIAQKLTGPGAGVRKYDLLTALAVAGLAGSPGFATSMTRLIALVTARYNWRLDEVSIGQAELARLWSVDVRTVKREVKRLGEQGLLTIKRAATRGRVATYQLGHARVEEITRSAWTLVGPDYVDRMEGQGGQIVPFPATAEERADRSEWSQARSVLRRSDPSRAKAWFDPLMRVGRAGGILTLQAPSDFHADYVTNNMLGEVLRAVRGVDAEVIKIIVAAG